VADCHHMDGAGAKNMKYPLCFSHNIILSSPGEVCTLHVDLFFAKSAREKERKERDTSLERM